MRIIGCDLHARQQVLAMLDTTTGKVLSMTLKHEGNNVREFYSTLAGTVRVGTEATGSMQWFVNLMEELGKLDEGFTLARLHHRHLPRLKRNSFPYVLLVQKKT